MCMQVCVCVWCTVYCMCFGAVYVNVCTFAEVEVNNGYYPLSLFTLHIEVVFLTKSRVC